ncbi:hypothetical protein F1559_005098 [Cyanidiococcus yangmingshanensis]|uniref:Uncharacterized protein n=1 Tax=Cyanidiococcus yangmingshanensis TaxID=2690220 RepID=A0A7J7ISG2_9RHOD|nr:hypothetical protein F1559_005098 [Cyanidiococcus yangmingshanensis]
MQRAWVSIHEGRTRPRMNSDVCASHSRLASSIRANFGLFTALIARRPTLMPMGSMLSKSALVTTEKLAKKVIEGKACTKAPLGSVTITLESKTEIRSVRVSKWSPS